MGNGLNYEEMKKYIERSGLKQKKIAEKVGTTEARISLILNGKRKCEVGMYADICEVLGVKMEKFIYKTKN